MEEVFDPVDYVLPLALLVMFVILLKNKPKCLKA